jgi:hypothetical protein
MKALLLVFAYLALADEDCFLLGGDDAEKPSPSLIKCYRHNNMACCVAAHDANIESDYGTILPGNC